MFENGHSIEAFLKIIAGLNNKNTDGDDLVEMNKGRNHG